MTEPIELDVDLSAFVGLMDSIPKADPLKYYWDEDDLHPITAEESGTSLSEMMAEARERGWIPQDDPGCQCLTCRLFREATGAQAPR